MSLRYFVLLLRFRLDVRPWQRLYWPWRHHGSHHWYFLQNLPDTYESTGVATLAFFLFQFAFADTCSTITSGAMLGRTGFWGDLWYSIGVSGFLYPIFGHWSWGPDGWLNNIKPAAFHDFAGSTVVHTIGGMIALAGAIVLGPRLGRKFKRDGGGPMPYHNMTVASVGAVILWFGWYGFNPGSTLSAMDTAGIAPVSQPTPLWPACAGGLGALFFVYPRSKKWDCGATVNGLLAGLVAITCPCYWVSPLGAIILGAVAGVIVILATDLLEFLRIDDPCGAWPVHGACGILGTWSLGLFATGQFGAPTPTGADNSAGSIVKGLFYGGGTDQLIGQIIGNAAIGIGVFIAAMILLDLVKATGTLRVSKEGELEGLDLPRTWRHCLSGYDHELNRPDSIPHGDLFRASQASVKLWWFTLASLCADLPDGCTHCGGFDSAPVMLAPFVLSPSGGDCARAAVVPRP